MRSGEHALWLAGERIAAELNRQSRAFAEVGRLIGESLNRTFKGL